MQSLFQQRYFLPLLGEQAAQPLVFRCQAALAAGLVKGVGRGNRAGGRLGQGFKGRDGNVRGYGAFVRGGRAGFAPYAGAGRVFDTKSAERSFLANLDRRRRILRK